MKRKLNNIVNSLEDQETIECILGLMFAIYLVLCECVAIYVAVAMRNYLALSFFTYLWICIITECYIKKCLFERLNIILLRKISVSNIIFFVVGLISIILSWKYFIAFLLCIPQAILYGEYCRLKKERRVH